jgi:hypothetical protein
VIGCSGADRTSHEEVASAAIEAHTAYRDSSRTAPSGRSAMSVASPPATSTHGQRGVCSTRAADSAMISTSKVAQPTHCSRLSAVGR